MNPKRVIDVFYTRLGFEVTPFDEPFRILGVSKVPRSPINIQTWSISCREIYEIFTNVKVHLTPSMTPQLYWKLFKVGGGGTELKCDKLNQFIETIDGSYFKDADEYFLQNLRSMHIYELGLMAFKEELYYPIAYNVKTPFVFKREIGEPPIHLLTVPKVKVGMSNPKRIYILLYELFLSIFVVVNGKELIMSNLVSSIIERMSKVHRGDLENTFWRAFFDALEATKVPPSSIKVYFSRLAYEYFKQSSKHQHIPNVSFRVSDDVFELVKRLYSSEIVKNVTRFSTDVIEEAMKYKLETNPSKTPPYVIVFGDPEEMLGGRVGGRFNENKFATQTETFATLGTSSLTSLSLVEPEVSQVLPDRESLFAIDWDAPILDVYGTRINFPKLEPGKYNKPSFERFKREIGSNLYVKIDQIERDFFDSSGYHIGDDISHLEKTDTPLYEFLIGLRKERDELGETFQKFESLYDIEPDPTKKPKKAVKKVRFAE